MFEFWASILIFGTIISKSCLFEVKEEGEGWSGDLLEISSLVSEKKVPHTPCFRRTFEE